MQQAAQTIPSYKDLIEANLFQARQIKELKEDKQHLEDLVRLLKRQRFAPKSEVQNAGQGTLFNEAETLTAEDTSDDDANEAEKDDPEPKSKPKNRGKPVRSPLPADLPRVDRIIDLPESQKVCPAGLPLKRMGEEVNEQLGVKPAEPFVLRTIRPKYAPCDCPACQARRDGPAYDAASEKAVKIMPLPAQPNLPRERVEFDLDDADKFCKIHGQPLVRIGEKVTEKLTVIPMQVKVTELTTFTYKAPCCEGCKDEFIRSEKEPEAIPKSIASSELLAFIATSKFEDALPLYRMEKIFARYGIEINRTSMARWMIQLSQLVVPLLNLLHEELLASASLHYDETVIQVLNEKDRRPEQNSYMWCLARSYEKPIIYFAYHESRSKKAATQLLDGYEGVLQTDGLKTYDSLAKLWPVIVLAACWAHVRRKFFHAEKEEKKGKRLAKYRSTDQASDGTRVPAPA